MEPFEMKLEIGGKIKTVVIKDINGFFEVIHKGKIIALLRPPGEDWQMLPLEQMAKSLPRTELESLEDGSNKLTLHTLSINQITGEIENRLKHI